MSMERRRNRSEIMHEALGLYLQAAAERAGVKAIVVANEDGFLIAGSGSGFNHEWLAALASVCAEAEERKGSLKTLVEDVTGGERFFSSTLNVLGRTLYLSSVGTNVSGEMVEPALSRILSPAILPN